jgi:superoxide dismutase, Fe-Mn family
MVKRFFTALVLSSLSLFAAAEQAQPESTNWGKTFTFKAKDYSNLYGMKGFDDELISIHLKLYEGYVKFCNLILNDIRNIDMHDQEGIYDYGLLKRRLGWEYDGMRLHELYFENLAGNGQLNEKGALYKQIEKNFGTYEHWKRDFIATAMMRGPGWVILYKEPQDGRLVNVWIDEHANGHIPGADPLLVLDVWEHAYMTQYKLDKKKYIDAFFININWDAVEKRLK